VNIPKKLQEKLDVVIYTCSDPNSLQRSLNHVTECEKCQDDINSIMDILYTEFSLLRLIIPREKVNKLWESSKSQKIKK
jgi:hypothetical protein